MPNPSAFDLVADWLSAHGYAETLQQLQIEADKKYDADREFEESLDDLVADRLRFSEVQDNEIEDAPVYTSQQLKLIKDKHVIVPRWTTRKPSQKHSLDILPKGLVIYAGFSRAHIGDLDVSVGLFSTSAKVLCLYNLDADEIIQEKEYKVAVKGAIILPATDILVACGLDGELAVSRVGADGIITSLKLHKRLVTDLKYLSVSSTSGYLASIGWDSFLVVYRVDFSAAENPEFTLVARHKLLTKPTCLCVTAEPGTNKPVLLVGRSDSSLVGMFTIENDKLAEVARLSLNDSEFSSHAFHPMSMALTGPDLLTVATNHVPFLRLVTVVLPKMAGISASAFSAVPVVRDIIVSNLNSLTPQDKYSTPIILGRPSGRKGAWLLADDGQIRGFDFETGKVVESLAAHSGRIKAAFVGATADADELLVSCGATDKAIVVWK